MSKSNIISLASALISRAKWGAFAGTTFEGKRDLYAKLGYKRNLSFEDYYARYVRGGIAGKVVDAFPSATWRNSPIITSNNKEFQKEFEKLAQRLKLFHYLERVDRLSGIGQYGVMLIGLSGGSALENAAPKVNGPDDIIYFSTFAQGNASIFSLEQDASSPDFGLPSLYDVNLFGDLNDISEGLSASTLTGQRKVHASRIIHVAEGLKEDEIFGAPRMERVWNYLDDLDKIIGGSSEAVWLTADRGIQFDVDKDANLQPDDLEDFSDEIDEYMHGMRRFIRTQGITAKVLGSEVPNPTGQFGVVAAALAGTINIPLRVLFGSERGQLASSQDEKNFNGKVKERQKHFAEPLILRPFIDRLQDIGALPQADYEIVWPDLSTLTKKDHADVAARVAQSLNHFEPDNGAVTVDEFRTHFLGLTTAKEAGVDVELANTPPTNEPGGTPSEDEVEEGTKDKKADGKELRAEGGREQTPLNVKIDVTNPAPTVNVENTLPAVNLQTTNNIPEAQAPVINVDAPKVNVEQPTIEVNIPAQEPPTVHIENIVETPEVNVENQVATPEVNVSNTVNVPETKVEVTNNVETPEVNVTVEKGGDKKVNFTRNTDGKITKATIEEDNS